jgi:rhodanese-related sulfurtransferase
MKILSIILLGLIVVFSSSAGGSQELSGEISGQIEGGLRILQVDDNENELDFTVYRGDYIVFEFENDVSSEFTVPGLEVDTIMPQPETEKSYVKIKKSGDYSFTLGSRKGVFHVKELVDANYHEVTAEEASDLIKNVKPLIVDVRTSGEYQSGHILEAELLPVQIFADNIGSLEKYKDEDILLYCASGNRSTVAARMLIDAGFTKVYNLRNGIGDWARKGNPVE